MAHTTSREEIAANVRAAMAYGRVEHGAIAQLLGKSRPAVSDRLRGLTHFRVDELQAIAVFLDVPLEQLLAPAPQEASA